jgi:uncharacterized Zn-binding protein involved in type VI secretion
MPAIVLVGHSHTCPRCGSATVESGDESYKVNGRAVARVSDTLSCGAVITSGSSLMKLDGKPVARVGDSTDHGGTLEEGDNSWQID